MNSLTIFFVHHKYDELTKLHLLRLKKFNPTATVIPVSFFKTDLCGGMKDSYIWPWDIPYLRYDNKMFTDMSWQRYSRCDVPILNWVYHNKIKTDNVLIAEYDLLCNTSVANFYQGNLNDDVVGSWLPKLSDGHVGYFQSHLEKDFGPEFENLDCIRSHISAIMPMAGAFFSTKAFNKMMEPLVEEPLLRNMQCECRLGTAASMVGYESVRIKPFGDPTIDSREYIIPTAVDPLNMFGVQQALPHRGIFHKIMTPHTKWNTITL